MDREMEYSSHFYGIISMTKRPFLQSECQVLFSAARLDQPRTCEAVDPLFGLVILLGKCFKHSDYSTSYGFMK